VNARVYGFFFPPPFFSLVLRQRKNGRIHSSDGKNREKFSSRLPPVPSVAKRAAGP